MKTLRFLVDPDRINEPEAQAALDAAAAILRADGTVALPTETVYGLGANALDASAVARIFEAKDRPNWDPLIVHVADMAMLETLVTDVPDKARLLMAAFWPGPLTLLLPRSAAVPDAVTAGRSLVGVRMPAHPVARELIRRAGVPVAAPSANRFGHTSPTTAEHVLEDLDGRIDAVVDSGPTAFGVESTVLDPCSSPMVVYRPGAVTLEQIRAVAGLVELFADAGELASIPREAMPSPGVGLRHYAPRARLILVEGEGDVPGRLAAWARAYAGDRVGLMLPDGFFGENRNRDGVELFGAAEVFAWGRWPRPGEDSHELAHRLFAGLRYLDAVGCTVILCPVPPDEGIGGAIRDRLRKAAHTEQAAHDGII
jgi:L-threonylcarbamoyladenylate synthase